MLTKAANPSRNEGNTLVTGIKHSPDNVIVEFMGEILDQNEGSGDGAVLGQPCNKSKGRRKETNRPTSSSEKAKKLPWTPETVAETSSSAYRSVACLVDSLLALYAIFPPQREEPKERLRGRLIEVQLLDNIRPEREVAP